MSESGAATDEPVARPRVEQSLPATLVAALVVGGALASAAQASALALLVAVAVAQAVLALCWILGTAVPGRKGGLLVGGVAAIGADVAVSVWPHGRLGCLLAVAGLAVPVLFVHQLARGAARAQVVSSLAGIGFLVLAEVALAAYPQLRHEFSAAPAASSDGGRVTAAVLVCLAGALVVGCLVDMVLPMPRVDAEVRRGLPALLASAVFGGASGYLMLSTRGYFPGGRAVFVGAALGALAGLLAVAASFVLHTSAVPGVGLARSLRPTLGALLPLAVLAPVAFLLALAFRP